MSNCRQNRKQPAAALGAPPRNDVEMAGGDDDGHTSHDGQGDDNQGVDDEVTITPILQEDGQPIRELVETPKPKKKVTKRARERDEITTKVLSMLEKDDDEDEVTLALASIGKRIKKSLKEGQVDAVIDELNEVVGRHVRAARSGGVMGYQRQPTIQQPGQIQPPPHIQAPPQQQLTNNYQPIPPDLQRMEIAYDAMNNNTYQNL